ncbi:hypothetical protein WMF38_13450 [Sorangium sp. So ce118]
MTRLDDPLQATAADTERLDGLARRLGARSDGEQRRLQERVEDSIPSEAGRVALYGGPVDALPAEKNPHVP